jgi:hypothetical protein
MNKILALFLGLTIILLRPGKVACGPSDSELSAIPSACGISYSPEHPPRFEDFPVAVNFSGQPAPINLKSHNRAQLFRTRLTEGAAKGPNFAGHYTVVMWGCGTACQMLAVVDATNGQVAFAPFATSEGASYRLDSRLFIGNPPENLKLFPKDFLASQNISVEYYIWENDKLRLICKLPISLLEKIAEPGQPR